MHGHMNVTMHGDMNVKYVEPCVRIFILLKSLIERLHYGDIYITVGGWVWAQCLKLMVSE
jgi:hypothetical protein